MTQSKHFRTIKYTIDREIGTRTLYGTQRSLCSTLYSHFHSYGRFDSCADQGQDWGGIFGFGFSPDGKLLATACENKCILLYDSGNAKLIKTRYKTHDDCVNCVRFLDDRIFATCSDDNTVRLWDSRFLKEELRIFRGHTNWVKNIEYSPFHSKLITSGFDGNIYAWDINKYSDECEHLLFIKETMRTKMTRDESKLIISTFRGYFLLIHDLDLDHLKEDLHGLRRHLYRRLQTMGTSSQNYIMNGRKRNRVEFVCDFPEKDEAESISTMQIHPHGWCIVSRNTSSDEESEWTCVHDIQSRPSDLKSKCSSTVTETSSTSARTADTLTSLSECSHSSDNSTSGKNISAGISLQRESTSSPPIPSDSDSFSQNHSRSDEINTNTEPYPRDTGRQWNASIRLHRQRLSTSSDDENSVEADAPPRPSLPSLNSELFEFSSTREGRSIFLQRLLLSLNDRVARQERNRGKFLQQPEGSTSSSQSHFYKAEPRLLYFAEEPNVGRGFIKEQSFSPDGRIIASPYGNHVRLLAFDKNCTEMCDSIPNQPTTLHEVANCALLKSSILASTFSPVDCMFVAGARDGSVAFSQPVL